MTIGPDQASCLVCGHVSVSRHSSYFRTLTDLPVCGALVVLKIRVALYEIPRQTWGYASELQV
jgi:hypothetical protein